MPEGHIEDDREFLTSGDIASEWRISQRTVYRWIESGKLKATRMPGGQYRIARADVDAAITVLEVEQPPTPATVADLAAKLDRLIERTESAATA